MFHFDKSRSKLLENLPRINSEFKILCVCYIQRFLVNFVVCSDDHINSKGFHCQRDTEKSVNKLRRQK